MLFLEHRLTFSLQKILETKITIMQAVIGWIGALLYIIAYFLISIKKLQADQVIFQLLNILGGVCLVVNSLHQSDYPSVFTNGVWASIGIFAIYYNKRK